MIKKIECCLADCQTNGFACVASSVSVSRSYIVLLLLLLLLCVASVASFDEKSKYEILNIADCSNTPFYQMTLASHIRTSTFIKYLSFCGMGEVVRHCIMWAISEIMVTHMNFYPASQPASFF